MSGNYPPGVDAGHPHFNPPDTSHDHEWGPSGDSFVLEDGAAIFTEECMHITPTKVVEGYRGESVVEEGIECEEIRTIRFDPVEITNLASYGDMTNLTIDRSAKMSFEDLWDEEIETMEIADANGSIEVVDVDPHYRSGQVVVRHDGIEIKYEPLEKKQ
jgi:hypothetical protein